MKQKDRQKIHPGLKHDKISCPIEGESETS